MANAKKKTTTDEAKAAGATAEEFAPECPVFMLRADRKGHLHALIAAAAHLREDEMGEAIRTIREFELYDEVGR